MSTGIGPVEVLVDFGDPLLGCWQFGVLSRGAEERFLSTFARVNSDTHLTKYFDPRFKTPVETAEDQTSVWHRLVIFMHKSARYAVLFPHRTTSQSESGWICAHF